MLNLKIADLVTDQAILESARSEAQAVVETDPRLSEIRNQPIREMVLKAYGKNLGLIEVG
jgi:RecG-like helicase